MSSQSFLVNFILNSEIFKEKVEHKITVYRSETKILEYGQTYPSFYFIKKGAVKIQVVEGQFGLRENATPIVTNLGMNAIFGEFGLFIDVPASTDVVTIVETEVIEIDKKSFVELLNSDPELGYKILTELFIALSKQINHLNKSLYHLFVK